jgi:hypothetical protein
MTKLGLLFSLISITAVVYFGYQILPIFYNNAELSGQMQAQADLATVLSDEQIRGNLLAKIRRLEIPIDNDDDLKINRLNDKIVIELSYEETVYIEVGDWSRDLYTFQFNPVVEQDL